MITQIYNNYSLDVLDKSSSITWAGVDINHFIAAGTIAAAFVGIIAAAVAIFIHYSSLKNQNLRDIAHKNEEEDAFLNGICSELNRLYEHYKEKKEGIEEALGTSQPCYKISTGELPIFFYRSNVGKVGILKEEELRDKIISIYTFIQIHHDNMIFYQGLIKLAEDFNIAMQVESNRAAKENLKRHKDLASKNVEDYTSNMHEQLTNVVSEISEVIELIKNRA